MHFINLPKKKISWVAILLLLVACNNKYKENKGKTVFRYNESAGITSLDTAFARSQANIWAVNQLFNGLVQLDDELKVQPSIAKNWDISPDGLSYTFHLRNDVFFHPDDAFGSKKTRKVIAQDFVYSLERILSQKIASPGAWVLSQVKVEKEIPAFEAPDDSTFVVKLKSPFPPFLGLLTTPYCAVVPKECIDKYKEDFRRHPVGTGAFKFGMWKENVKLVLLKNPEYFEFERNKRLPYLDAIAITFIIDKQTAFLEFVKGNLDFISGIDAGYKDEILTPTGELKSKYKDRIELTKQPYLNTEYLGFLVDDSIEIVKNSPLKNKLIRQALNYGFDRVRMMKYLRNNIGIAAVHGIIPPGMPWVNVNNIEGYGYNPAKALQLLKQAGFPEGRGLPAITLTTNASYVDLCKYIQSQLGEIGIKIKIDITPPATLREMMAQSKVNFFRGSWIADYPDAENYLSLFYAPNYAPVGPNYTHFKSKKFDKLYEESILQRSDSLRGSLYEKMDKLVMDEAPVMVLFYDEVLRFYRKNIEGLGSNAMNLLQLKKVKKNNSHGNQEN